MFPEQKKEIFSHLSRATDWIGDGVEMRKEERGL